MTPLWYTYKLGMLCQHSGFDKWDLIGISAVRDLVSKGKIKSFEELQKEYHLSDKEAFRYLQVRHALTATLPKIGDIPEASPLEDRLLDGQLHSKAISLTYKKLCNNMPDTFSKLKEKWEEDLGIIEEDDWRVALMSPREAAITMRYRLIQLRILHRSYMTGVVLARIGSRATDLCVKGCQHQATFYHSIWSCPLAQHIWTAATTHLQTALSKSITLTPKLGLLNIWDATDLGDIDQHLVTLGYTLVKRELARGLGSAAPPSVAIWLKELDRCMLAETEVFVHRGCPKKWDKKWACWNRYRGNICVSPTVEMEMCRITIPDFSEEV